MTGASVLIVTAADCRRQLRSAAVRTAPIGALGWLRARSGGEFRGLGWPGDRSQPLPDGLLVWLDEPPGGEKIFPTVRADAQDLPGGGDELDLSVLQYPAWTR